MRGASPSLRARVRRPHLDPVELGLLLAFGLLSMWVVALDLFQVVVHHRVWTGTDGGYIVDQLQYLSWIRSTADHGLVANLFVLRGTPADYFQPGISISAVLSLIGLPGPVALLVWKPVAVVSLFAAGILLLVAFLISQVVQSAPMFDLSLFRKPAFNGASIVAFTLSASMLSMFLYLTLYLQTILSLSPLQTGVRFLPFTVVSFFAAAGTGRLTSRAPARLLLFGGLALTGVGLMLMRGLTGTSSWTALLPGFIVAGAGVGLINPSLASTEQRLLERLTTLLAERQLLAIGVARDQLVIDGIATEGRHQLLRALAERLHAHQIAGIKFLGGVTKSEIEELLVRVGRDPRGAEDRREPLSGVSSPPGHHVQLYRQAYERLALAEDDGSMPIAAPAVARGTQLWLELALAAMSAQDANVSADIDPTIMARAIEARAIEAHADGDAPAAAGGADAAVYNQVVAGHLMQIAGELRSTQGADTATLRDRVSTLVTALSPRAIEGLITMGGNLTQRRAFLSDATAGMGVDAVLALTAATASVAKRPISQPLVRVLTKLAGHAQRGTAHIRPAADLAFRDHVRELVDGWTAPDLTAAGYGDVLDTLTRPPSPDDAGPITSGVTQFCEPERLLEMCIDLRNASTPLWDAVGALIARGNIVALLDTLDKTPADNPLLGVIRTRIATQENLRRLLDSPAVDGQRIEDFARRVGAAATDVLLDALASAKTRTARRSVALNLCSPARTRRADCSSLS